MLDCQAVCMTQRFTRVKFQSSCHDPHMTMYSATYLHSSQHTSESTSGFSACCVISNWSQTLWHACINVCWTWDMLCRDHASAPKCTIVCCVVLVLAMLFASSLCCFSTSPRHKLANASASAHVSTQCQINDLKAMSTGAAMSVHYMPKKPAIPGSNLLHPFRYYVSTLGNTQGYRTTRILFLVQLLGS